MHNQLAVSIHGETLVLDVSGAAYWPAQETLIFADLHFEKGSSYARGRQFLPPYDTEATLTKMAGAVRRLRPRRVVALGDSFHDPDAADRMSGDARAMLKALAGEFIWISGNHDPRPPAWAGGMVTAEWRAGGLIFRHEPQAHPQEGEIAGHLHPCANVAKWGRSVRRRCFAADGARMVLPSFGAYTGGLDVGEEPIAQLFGSRFHAFMLGEERVYAIPREQGRKDRVRPGGVILPTITSPW